MFSETLTAEVPSAPGDCLLLVTDALLEAAHAGSDEFFGDAGLERVVRRLDGSAGVSDVVLAAYREWIGDATPLADNATLVAVERV